MQDVACKCPVVLVCVNMERALMVGLFPRTKPGAGDRGTRQRTTPVRVPSQRISCSGAWPSRGRGGWRPPGQRQPGDPPRVGRGAAGGPTGGRAPHTGVLFWAPRVHPPAGRLFPDFLRRPVAAQNVACAWCHAAPRAAVHAAHHFQRGGPNCPALIIPPTYFEAFDSRVSPKVPMN